MFGLGLFCVFHVCYFYYGFEFSRCSRYSMGSISRESIFIECQCKMYFYKLPGENTPQFKIFPQLLGENIPGENIPQATLWPF